jgi:hypothetical protein
MPLRQLRLIIGIILLLTLQTGMYIFINFRGMEAFSRLILIVYSQCPLIYRMIDKDHSYCAKKASLRSLAPTKKEIELILEMHNQERLHVNAKDMQKMVIKKWI